MYDACYCDFDQPEFYSARRIKSARKPHRCEECRREIKPGESYEVHNGKWEGAFDTFIWCSHCADLCAWARISVPCFCWYFGDLHENIRDMVREVARDVPGLFMEYGRRMIRLRRAGGCR